MSMLGWLITWSVNGWTRILWISWSLIFLPYLLLCFICPTGICCFCSHECSAIFYLSISPFVVFRLCSFTLVCKSLHVSPMYCFPHSRWMLYLIWKLFWCRIYYLSFLIFLICLVRMVLSLILWVSLVLCDDQSFCVSLLVCSVGIHWLSMLRLFVDILYVDRIHLSRSRWHGFGDWWLWLVLCFLGDWKCSEGTVQCG